MTATVHTASAEATQTWGQRLAHLLFPGSVVGLEGDLGAGKTCFVKGVAIGLGLDEEDVSSPTFTLIAEHYRGRMPLYHIDLYRLQGAEVTELGIEEYLFGQGVTVIEWFQFLPVGVVEEYLHIAVAFKGAEERMLTLTARGERYERMAQAMVEGFRGQGSELG